METQGKHIEEMGQWIATVEDELHKGQVTMHTLDRQYQLKADKIDDLENRSRRNNLRIAGLPESYKEADLQYLGAEAVPHTLGIKHMCVIERAHTL